MTVRGFDYHEYNLPSPFELGGRMFDVAALDFETAAGRDAVCAVGIYLFGPTGNKEFETLVNPEIAPDDWDPMAIAIHGIRPSDVRRAPTFPEVWAKLLELIPSDVPLIAHNAAFDMSVLRATLNRYEMTPRAITYACTGRISKKVWPEIPTTRLDYISSTLGYSFKHHDALEDAKASAFIFQQALSSWSQGREISTLESFLEQIDLQMGMIHPDLSYRPCGKVGSKNNSALSFRKVGEFTNAEFSADPGHPFFGKNVVFTGTLLTMTKNQAKQIVSELGGKPQSDVSKKTDFLVAGEQDLFKFKPGVTESQKMQKALELVSQGEQIEIIGENDFIRMILIR